tara:strand:+ start:1339 stop:1518 length:180 start_codon:yes stop_codon:yes gene_type:complete
VKLYKDHGCHQQSGEQQDLFERFPYYAKNGKVEEKAKKSSHEILSGDANLTSLMQTKSA